MGAERVPVLMYHRVGEARNDWEARYTVSPARFAAHVRALAAKGFRAVDVDAFFAWLEGGAALPEGALLITFDDGFLGVHDHAWPVLRELGWPFTVFLVSDLIGATDEWTRTANPAGVTHPLLDGTHIRVMQDAGVAFHSHTRTHASLIGVDDETLREELAGSRRRLTELLGREADYVAYPFGHSDRRVESAAREAGYRGGFSTQPGFNRQDVDRYRVRRLDVFGTDSAPTLLRKVHLASNDGSLAHVARYYLARAAARLPLPGR